MGVGVHAHWLCNEQRFEAGPFDDVESSHERDPSEERTRYRAELERFHTPTLAAIIAAYEMASIEAEHGEVDSRTPDMVGPPFY